MCVLSHSLVVLETQVEQINADLCRLISKPRPQGPAMTMTHKDPSFGNHHSRRSSYWKILSYRVGLFSRLDEAAAKVAGLSLIDLSFRTSSKATLKA